MEPMAGCTEIFDARSRVSAENMAGEVTEPGVGSVKPVDWAGSIGRRGVRKEIERAEEGIENLYIIRARRGLERWAGYRGVAAGARRLADAPDGRATTRRQRRAFMMPPPRLRWRREARDAGGSNWRKGRSLVREGAASLSPTKSTSGPCIKKCSRENQSQLTSNTSFQHSIAPATDLRRYFNRFM
ncbi:hypothetical protein PMIN01_11534 [Paraphaeosphaeria minitans]|uniref:Uncharacterized protein n=1 Tax=Paraphaeosphaeria minitans TaxID=565426 RepID=A0A9P6G8Z7_9PLEO|nr:hypothetical protein PMIN01_11534 [Paraphaeosphaeria minitans]